MHAVKRICAASAMLILLFLAVGIVDNGMFEYSPIPRSYRNQIVGLGGFLSIIYVAGYLIAPLTRHAHNHPDVMRPWRSVLVFLGAVIILFVVGLGLQIIHSAALPLGGRENIWFTLEQVWVFDVVWTSLSILVAVLYIRYPIPRSLRSGQGDLTATNAISPRVQIDV